MLSNDEYEKLCLIKQNLRNTKTTIADMCDINIKSLNNALELTEQLIRNYLEEFEQNYYKKYRGE